MADSLERRDTLLITHDNFQQRQRQTVNVDSELLWRVERWVGDNITSVNDPAFQSVNQGPILEYMSECHRSTSTQVERQYAQSRVPNTPIQTQIHNYPARQSDLRSIKTLEQQPYHQPGRTERCYTQSSTPTSCQPLRQPTTQASSDLSDSDLSASEVEEPEDQASEYEDEASEYEDEKGDYEGEPGEYEYGDEACEYGYGDKANE